jgi:hypothetical protein
MGGYRKKTRNTPPSGEATANAPVALTTLQGETTLRANVLKNTSAS